MKRIFAIVLSIVLFLPCISSSISAEENYKFYHIQINAGNGIKHEKAIIQDGEIYISAVNFSKYTRFAYDEENSMFVIKGQDFKKAFKTVMVDVENKQLSIMKKSDYKTKLSNCFEVDGIVYLPFCQMLPILNADIYQVKDNVIYISNHELSLAEVLYDFNMSETYFNLSTEFLDNDLLVKGMVLPAILLDTITSWRYDRLNFGFASDNYEDYKNAFSKLLTEDNLYLEAKAKKSDILDITMEFFHELDESSNDFKSVYDWIEEADKSKLTVKEGGILLDLLKESAETEKWSHSNLKEMTDTWVNKRLMDKKLSFSDIFGIAEFVYNYHHRIEDNCEMLNAVYDLDSYVWKKNTERNAAKQVYEIYGNNAFSIVTNKIGEFFGKELLEDISIGGIYQATAEVAGIVLEGVLPISYSDIAMLPTFSNIVQSSSSKYLSYGTATDEETEKLRCSLLLCFMASKQCFETVRDTFKGMGNDDIYYQNKIEKLEKLIMGLYIAGDNVKFDSFEHFEEYKNNNLIKIKEVVLNSKNYLWNENAITILFEPRKDLSQELALSVEIQLEDGSEVVWENNTAYSTNGTLIAFMETEQMEKQKVTLLEENALYIVTIEQPNYANNDFINYPIEGEVSIEKGNRVIFKEEVEEYRSHTAYYFGGVCEIDHGEIKEYDASWIVPLWGS